MAVEKNNMITVHSLKRRDTDYQDLGEVHVNVDEILNLGNTFRDKLAFMAFAMGIYGTFFIFGWAPNYFYLWYTGIILYLTPYRWYFLKQMRYHYILFDFCYFANATVLIYLWAPSQLLGEATRGYLFPVIFAVSTSLLYFATLITNNSLVLHSTDKMSQLFYHLTPGFALFGVRFFATEDQEFPLCAHPTEPGINGCNHVDYFQLLVLPITFYIGWLILYILIVEVLLKARIKRKGNTTMYIYFSTRKSLNSWLYSILGVKYHKMMFYIINAAVLFISVPLGYLCYFSKTCFVIWTIVVCMGGSYNGASYYIEVFSQRYYTERVLKTEKKKST